MQGAANRRLILSLLCTASFGAVFNNLILAPLIPAISDDLGVPVATAGLLVTAYAIVGGTAAILSGPLIDRLGRRRMVLWGMTVLTIATALSAVAPNYFALMAARMLAGLGVASLTPAVFAAVGDYFSYEERGRAMAWVISANTSASILGVPLGAFISGLLSWRWSFVLMAGLSLVFTALLFARLPDDSAGNTGRSRGLRDIASLLRDRPTALLTFSNYLATGYWNVFSTFMGAYFHEYFHVSAWALGGLTMVMGIGVLTGSNIGGRICDTSGKRPVVLASTALCAVFMTLITVIPFIAGALIALLLFATAAGARYTSAQAVLSEMDPERRGSVMALFASGQQFGIVTGSALGGLVLSVGGYHALGPVAGAIALFSLWTYAMSVNEHRFGGAAERLEPRESPA